jgi:hypothetical protein
VLDSFARRFDLGLWPLVLVGVGLAVSAWLRLSPLTAEFPLGDGGLFAVMVLDLRDNGFVPPELTTFNAGDIPWMYPPLGLYLTALLGGGLEWFRLVPALLAVATLPALWLLARALTNERAALFAVVAYGLTVSAWFGLVAGGGVTRTPGVILAMLTMWAVVRGHVGRAGFFAGLVILTHPIAALYGGLGAAALWATRGADRRMLLAPVLALAIGAAWFGPMVARHGLDALLGLGGSRAIDLGNNAFTLLAATLNPPNLGFLIGAVGVVVSVRRRRWDLIAWLATSFVGGAVIDRWAVIPLAVMAGLAVGAALEHPARMRSVALLGIAAAVAVTGVIFSGPPAALSAAEREVMAWAAAETDTDATFAEIGYPVDGGVVDWFPVLSGRKSVTTWQGTEWIAGGYRGEEAKTDIDCDELDCLPDADYYMLRPGCCVTLEASLTRVHANVFRREPPTDEP